MEKRPYFSVVIPAYNREKEVGRAISSCLRQGFRDFEVIVVDDASSDRTAEVVRQFGEDLVTLECHRQNRGPCAARNTGVRRAAGEWILFLDSDDEFEQGAFITIHQGTQKWGSGVDRLGFMYRLDTGGLSPDPPPLSPLLDYEGYLRWSAAVVRSDFNNCVRRSTFERVMLPESRIYESLYHLNFAKEFQTRLLPDVVAVIHSDAANRVLNLPGTARAGKARREAADGLRGVEELLALHGRALREFAPKRFEAFCRMRVVFCLLAGNRPRGLRLAVRHLLAFPGTPLSWIVPALGVLGPAALAWAQSRSRRGYVLPKRVCS